jgi:hypothetical protein
MHKASLLGSIVGLLISTSVHASQILLDQVMSREDQKKTGVANLTRNQKIALEAWLNDNFVLKTKEPTPTVQLSLSINIDNGQKLELSDNSVWEVSPDDVQTASVWITPFPVKITPSNDPEYPFLIVNMNTGISVKARKASPSTQ